MSSAGDPLPSLRRLYDRHSGKVSDKWSSYLEAYEEVFEPYRDRPVALLEIGVQNGGSLEIWAQYFKRATSIVGCDSDPACARLTFDDPRISVVTADATTDRAEELIRARALAFDLIIDDGSHVSRDVVASFARYFPAVAPGGLYVVEDLHSSYWAEYGGGLYHPYSAMSFFKRLLDVINARHWGSDVTPSQVLGGFAGEYELSLADETFDGLRSIEFRDSLCILRKEEHPARGPAQRLIVGSTAAVDSRTTPDHPPAPQPPDERANPWTNRRRPPDEEVVALEQELGQRERRLAEQDQRMAALASDLEAVRTSLAERDDEIAQVSRRLTEQQRALDDRNASIERLTRDGNALERLLDEERRQLALMREELASVFGSRSWRVTTPLRAVRRVASTPLARARLARALLGLATKRGVRRALRTYRDRRLIISSGVFEMDAYQRAYPDVAAAGMDPVLHYLLHGAAEGRNPSSLFDSVWYVGNNLDVAESGLNPLVHYLLHGTAEGRDPSPRFSSLGYLQANPDVAGSWTDPLAHYLTHGRLEGRSLRPDADGATNVLPSQAVARGSMRRRSLVTAKRVFEALPLPAAVKDPLKSRLRRLLNLDAPGGLTYAEWIRRNDTLTVVDREAIRRRIDQVPTKPTFSIVMPVYNTSAAELRQAIDSVVGQLYEHWELCIADDGSTLPHVRQILLQRASREPRIKLELREQNAGISACTNTALELAGGDWIVLMDHDDTLAEHALYMIADAIARDPDAKLIYSDEDHIDTQGHRSNPFFKPDWDGDVFLGQNVISHLGAYRADLVRAVGGFREGFEGSQDWDFALRFVEAAGGVGIKHVPHVLYHWRQSASAFSTVALSRAASSAKRAVVEHLQRSGQDASAASEGHSSYLTVTRNLPSPSPSVSVVIPTRDQHQLLSTCVDGVLRRTDYEALELVIVDNGTTEPRAVALLDRLASDKRVKLVRDPDPFNFSRLVNRGVSESSGEICVLLNNDIDVIEPTWLRELVSHAARPEVGAVGAKLFYADDTIQHAGVILGLGGVAGHAHRGAPRLSPGYLGNLKLVRNVSAVTAACLAVRRDVYNEVGGFNESDLPVAFNDVDFCLRVRAAGYRIIWTPQAALYHYESKTRGSDSTREQAARFRAECDYMERRWKAELGNDPFYNPNLSLEQSYVLSGSPRVAWPWLTTSTSEPVREGPTARPDQRTTRKHSARIDGHASGRLPYSQVVLVGHSASGKSRLARLLGLDRELADFDRFAVSRGGVAEGDVFAELLRQASPFVVAPNHRSILRELGSRKHGTYNDIAVIYLHRPPEIIRDSLLLTNEDGLNHAAMNDDEFQSYYETYDLLYRRAADYVFHLEDAAIDDVADAFQVVVDDLRSADGSPPGISPELKFNLFGEYLVARAGHGPHVPSTEDMTRMTAGGYQVFDTTTFPPTPLAGTTADMKLRDLRWTEAEFAGQTVTEIGSQLGFFGFVAAGLGARRVIGFDANPDFVAAANAIAAHYRRLCEWPDDRVMFRTDSIAVGDPLIGDADVIVANAIVHWFVVQHPEASIADVLAWLRDNAKRAVYFEGCVSASEPIMRQHGVSLDRYSEELFLAACRQVFSRAEFVGRCSYNPQRIVMRLYR